MARYKYDTELFLSDVKSIFNANLNAKIDEINLEKLNNTEETNDNFAISNINNNAWFLNHIPAVWNYPQFVVWGLKDVSLTEQQPDGAIQKVTVFIEVAIPDRGEQLKESTIYQLLRYSRALQEISMENFDKIRGYGKLQVDSLSPTLVDVSGKMLRISGVDITASFGIR